MNNTTTKWQLKFLFTGKKSQKDQNNHSPDHSTLQQVISVLNLGRHDESGYI